MGPCLLGGFVSSGAMHCRMALPVAGKAPSLFRPCFMMKRLPACRPCSKHDSILTDHGWTALPWSPSKLVISFTQVLCLQLPLAYGGVSIWCKLRGLPLESVSADEIGLAACASDSIQLLGVLCILQYGLLQPMAPLQQEQISNAVSDSPDQDPPASELNAPWPVLSYRPNVTAAVLGLASAASSLLAIALLSQISGSVDEGAAAGTSQVVQLMKGSNAPVLFALSNVVLGPVAEEIVYRGLLLPTLASYVGLPSALLVSSLAFAAYHLSWADMPALTALGLSLGCCTIGSKGNLLAPTLGHAAYNAAALGVAFLDI